MNFFYKLLNKIYPQFQKWYNFFEKLEWTEEQRIMIAEWNKKIPALISKALLDSIKAYYAEYGKDKTNEFVKRIQEAIDDMF